MKLDIIIGNPPYHEKDTSRDGVSVILYNKFINTCLNYTNKLIFIIPTRWLSDTPRGSSPQWLEQMRNRTDYKTLIEYSDSTQVFNGVSVNGGVGIFYIDKNYIGEADITYTNNNGNIIKRKGYLATLGVVIRHPEVISIVNKVQNTFGKENYTLRNSIKDLIGSTREFSKSKGDGSNYLDSNWSDFNLESDDIHYIKFYTNKKITPNNTGIGYITEEDLPPGTLDLAKEFKLFTLRSTDKQDKYINEIFIGGTNCCCSTTYAPIHGKEIDTIEKGNNYIKYISTAFAKTLIAEVKNTQHVSSDTFALIPIQDFSQNSDINWNTTIEEINQQLYKKYNLSQEEITYIKNVANSI